MVQNGKGNSFKALQLLIRHRMETQELVGYYTLRNFLNDPLPVDDFNRIKFLEAEAFFDRATCRVL